MKKIHLDPNSFIAPVITVLVLLLGLFLYQKVTGQSAVPGQMPGTFTVDGIGKIDAVPNSHTASYTINETGSTEKEAQEKGNTKQVEAKEALIALGFEEKDIKTDGYYINPNYEILPQGGSREEGFQINITTSIKSKDIEMINKALDELVSIGVQVGGVTSDVDTSNSEELKSQARAKAVENARMKAEELAKAGGFKVGKIASIYESIPYSPGPYPVFAERSSMGGAAQDATQIEPGTDSLSVQVSITYYIK